MTGKSEERRQIQDLMIQLQNRLDSEPFVKSESSLEKPAYDFLYNLVLRVGMHTVLIALLEIQRGRIKR